EGDEIILTTGTPDLPNAFDTNYPAIINDVQQGQRILIDDGQIALCVAETLADRLVCRVIVEGPLHSHKGINLPDSDVSAPAITDRDWQCVDWAIEHQLDYLALSFVRTADEVNELKTYLKQKDSPIHVVSKIEKPQAIEHLEDILHASDAALVARGDLGVEMDLAKVPLIQKRITADCRRLGKPVIVATQMLQSMITAPVPTRAEVSDVANAIIDYTDAVMCSGETAVGSYPVETVRAMSRICEVTEDFLDHSKQVRPRMELEEEFKHAAVMARSLAFAIDEIPTTLIAGWTDNGKKAKILSKTRIDVPILVFSDNLTVARQLGLYYGVVSVYHKKPDDIQHFFEIVKETILKQKWANLGDEIVLVPDKELLPEGTIQITIRQKLT
ncbi:MAG: pyruvate kinase, partial [Planctomycetota bacterium]